MSTTWFVNLSTGNDLSGGTTSATAFRTITRAINAAAASGHSINITRGASGAQSLFVNLTNGATTATASNITISNKTFTSITAGFTVESPVRTVASAVALGITGDTINVAGITTYNVDLSQGVDPVSGNMISWTNSSKTFSITAGVSATTGAYRTISAAISAAPVSGSTISIVRGASGAQSLFVNLTNGATTANASNITISGKTFTSITAGFTVESAVRTVASAVLLGITGDTINVSGITTLFQRASGGSDNATVSWTSSSKTFTITNGAQAANPFATLAGLCASANANVGTLIDTDSIPTYTVDPASSYTTIQVINNGGTKTYNTVLRTIQLAVNAAVAGKTVSIPAGTFNESVTVSKGITITGAGIDQTIINGQSGDHSILINNATGTLAIRDLTVNGTAGALPNIETAAIYIKGTNGSININGCKIVAQGDSALIVEGGVASSLQINNNIITGKTYTGSNTPVQTWTGSYYTALVTLSNGVYITGGTTQAQNTVPNIPRQLVVINPITGGTTQITGNTIGDGTNSTGAYDASGIMHTNTVMTCDTANATISGNTFNTACYAILTSNVALRVRGNGCTVTNNIFKNPVINGYILDNKTLSGTNGTNTVNYSLNTIDFTSASQTSGYTAVAASYANLPVPIGGVTFNTIPSGFTRNCWAVSGFTPIGSISALVCVGLGKIVASNQTTLLVAPAAGTSGSYSVLASSPGFTGTADTDAVNGNIIQLAPGSYASNAYITKSVTIKGVRGTNGNATDSTIINPSIVSGWPIVIQANNVTVQDLIIDDTFNSSSTFNNSGAFMMNISNAANSQVQNVLVKNVKFQNSRRRGVTVNTANNVTFDGCDFPQCYNYTLSLTSCQNLTVKNSTLPLGSWGTVGIFPTTTAVDMNTLGKSFGIDLSQGNTFADGAISGKSLTYSDGSYMTKAIINIQPVVGSSKPAGDITFGYDSTANVKLPSEFAYAIKSGPTSSLLNYSIIRQRYTSAAIFLEFYLTTTDATYQAQIAYLVEKDMLNGTLIVEDRFPVLKALELANNEPVLLTSASQIPANASVIVDKEIRDANGKKMIYTANINSTYTAMGNTEVVNIMPDAVSTGIPVVAFSVTKTSTDGYTEQVRPKSANGVLSKDLFVPSPAALLALGIQPPTIIAAVNLASLPTSTTADVSPSAGLPSGSITVTASSITLSNLATSTVTPSIINNTIIVPTGQQLSSTSAANRITVTTPTTSGAVILPVRNVPNDNASLQIGNIVIPAASLQTTVVQQPNYVVQTSGSLTIQSATSAPVVTINTATGDQFKGISANVDAGNYQIFTVEARPQPTL